MIEFCTGMQENEKDLEEFFKENPDFPHLNPLSEEFDKKYSELDEQEGDDK